MKRDKQKIKKYKMSYSFGMKRINKFVGIGALAFLGATSATNAPTPLHNNNNIVLKAATDMMASAGDHKNNDYTGYVDHQGNFYRYPQGALGSIPTGYVLDTSYSGTIAVNLKNKDNQANNLVTFTNGVAPSVYISDGTATLLFGSYTLYSEVHNLQLIKPFSEQYLTPDGHIVNSIPTGKPFTYVEDTTFNGDKTANGKTYHFANGVAAEASGITKLLKVNLPTNAIQAPQIKHITKYIDENGRAHDSIPTGGSLNFVEDTSFNGKKWVSMANNGLGALITFTNGVGSENAIDYKAIKPQVPTNPTSAVDYVKTDGSVFPTKPDHWVEDAAFNGQITINGKVINFTNGVGFDGSNEFKAIKPMLPPTNALPQRPPQNHTIKYVDQNGGVHNNIPTNSMLKFVEDSTFNGNLNVNGKNINFTNGIGNDGLIDYKAIKPQTPPANPVSNTEYITKYVDAKNQPISGVSDRIDLTKPGLLPVVPKGYKLTNGNAPVLFTGPTITSGVEHYTRVVEIAKDEKYITKYVDEAGKLIASIPDTVETTKPTGDPIIPGGYKLVSVGAFGPGKLSGTTNEYAREVMLIEQSRYVTKYVDSKTGVEIKKDEAPVKPTSPAQVPSGYRIVSEGTFSQPKLVGSRLEYVKEVKVEKVIMVNPGAPKPVLSQHITKDVVETLDGKKLNTGTITYDLDPSTGAITNVKTTMVVSNVKSNLSLSKDGSNLLNVESNNSKINVVVVPTKTGFEIKETTKTVAIPKPIAGGPVAKPVVAPLNLTPPQAPQNLVVAPPVNVPPLLQHITKDVVETLDGKNLNTGTITYDLDPSTGEITNVKSTMVVSNVKPNLSLSKDGNSLLNVESNNSKINVVVVSTKTGFEIKETTKTVVAPKPLTEVPVKQTLQVPEVPTKETQKIPELIEIKTETPKPIEVKPVEVKPIETKPVETKPVETKTETKIEETKIDTPKVIESKVEQKQVETKIDTPKVESKQVETKTETPKQIETQVKGESKTDTQKHNNNISGEVLKDLDQASEVKNKVPLKDLQSNVEEGLKNVSSDAKAETKKSNTLANASDNTQKSISQNNKAQADAVRGASKAEDNSKAESSLLASILAFTGLGFLVKSKKSQNKKD